MLERWPTASTLERRSLAEALGKSNSQAALDLLREEQPSDVELSRIIERARLMLERDLGRNAPSTIALDQALGASQSVIAHCRSGLSWVLADEARARASWPSTTVLDKDRVRLSHRGSLGELLQLRVALGFGLEIQLPGAAHDSLAPRVVAALEHPDAERAVRAWTKGRARFRLVFAEGGHQREKVWRLAAALARVAGVRADDIVWDPFVGSGLELIERGLLGPFRELHGSDLESAALAAARANAERAQLELRLVQGDARAHRVKGVSLIISNPPMGRRVTRDGNLGPLLDAFLANAATFLAPGGRVVWLSPFPDRTAASARRLGLKVTRHEPVDLGGFPAELQRFDR